MINAKNTTANYKHKNQKSLISYVIDYAKHGYNLSRRDNLVFYKLLGFLIKSDKPLNYSNEKLSQNTLYKITSIKQALNNLEKLGLIAREGITYRRRFYKGKVLVNICNHSQYCIFIELYNNCNHGQPVAGTGQPVAGTGQKATKIEVNKNNKELKKGEFFIDSKKQDEEHEKRLEKYKEMIEKRKLKIS